MANPGSGANTNGRSPSKCRICVLAKSLPSRQRLSSLLLSVGFEVHEFDSGGAFLLSETARHCDCLIVSENMLDVGVSELMQALLAAGIQTPVVHIPSLDALDNKQVLRLVMSSLVGSFR